MTTHLRHPPLLVEALCLFILDPWLLFRISPTPSPFLNGQKCSYYLMLLNAPYLLLSRPGELCGRRTHFEQPERSQNGEIFEFSEFGIMEEGIFAEFPESWGFRNEYERRIREHVGLGGRHTEDSPPTCLGASQ
ncbi:hypothetical protein CEXT_269521 [Caerostris extrusa]|uniref:Uncharacterized protein n=1 Tax=Caerostris extrusa TaxID=172846 RepID=A0AAV4MQN2_CAEEX|nr:hypothetical protein CEXT_269521 [Caerostris extrusa]